MAYYIKVTKAVADKLGLTATRNKTADGNVILWQSDLNKFDGTTIFDRAKAIGGVALTAMDAKREIDGTGYPVEPTIPEEYKVPTTESVEEIHEETKEEEV